MIFRSTAVAVVCSLSVSAFAGLPVEDRQEKKKGDTTATGSYKVYEEGGNVKIDVDFRVKITGVAGTGKGAMVFEILDDSYEPVFKIDKGFSVGSDALKGVARKEFKKTITLTGPKADAIRNDGLIAAFSVEVEKDTPGVPTSADEWKKEIKDWTSVAGEIIKAPVGELKEVGSWRFKKIK